MKSCTELAAQRRVQYGDIVKLDIGVIRDGWVGDNATTVAVGVIDERIDQLLRVTESALDAGDPGLPVKASVLATFVRRSKTKRGVLVFPSCANSSGTEWAEKCTRSRKFQIMANAAPVRN